MNCRDKYHLRVMKACVRKDYYVFPGKKNGLVFISFTTVCVNFIKVRVSVTKLLHFFNYI